MLDQIQSLDPLKNNAKPEVIAEGFDTYLNEQMQTLSLEDRNQAHHKEILEMKSGTFVQNLQESSLFSENEVVRITTVVSRLDIMMTSAEMTPELCNLIEEWLMLFKSLIKGGSLQESEAGMQANLIQSLKQKVISNMSWDTLITTPEEKEDAEGFQLFGDFSQEKEETRSSLSMNFDYMQLYLKNQSLVNFPKYQDEVSPQLENETAGKGKFLDAMSALEAVF